MMVTYRADCHRAPPWPGPQPSQSLLHLITSSLCTLLSRLTSTQYRCKAAHHLPIFFVLTFLQNPSGLQGWHSPVVQIDLVDRPLSACLRQTWAVGVLYGDMVKIMDMDNVQQLQLKPQSLVGLRHKVRVNKLNVQHAFILLCLSPFQDSGSIITLSSFSHAENR